MEDKNRKAMLEEEEIVTSIGGTYELYLIMARSILDNMLRVPDCSFYYWNSDNMIQRRKTVMDMLKELENHYYLKDLMDDKITRIKEVTITFEEFNTMESSYYINGKLIVEFMDGDTYNTGVRFGSDDWDVAIAEGCLKKME